MGERASDIILKLLSGFPEEAKIYGVDQHVWKIANIVKQDKKSREIVLGKDTAIALAALNDLEEFISFIDNHGHLGEVDPYFSKWAETPEKILNMIVNHLTYETEEPYIVYLKQQEERNQITNEIIADLKDNQNTQFMELLNTTQSLFKLYQYEEHSLVRKGLSSLRKLLLSIGRGFVSSKKLHGISDVFFLEYEGILKLRDDQKTEQFASLTAERREWFEDNRGISAHPIVTEQAVLKEVITETKEKIIKGLGASRGSASGTVKIIHSQDELWKVRKSEILVAPMTSPEFGPLLHLVNGIITDEGGICCHAAVVARELGIPAIVGTRNATRILKDGMKVKLDGTKGIVYFNNSE